MQEDDKPVNVEVFLDDLNFPREKREIVTYAQDEGASEDVLQILRVLPDKHYQSLSDLNDALGYIERQPGYQNQWSSRPANFNKTEVEDMAAEGLMKTLSKGA
ncbi:MAG: DUF2795 domain-containing protein [Alphaproteobacteria bacterium]